MLGYPNTTNIQTSAKKLRIKMLKEKPVIELFQKWPNLMEIAGGGGWLQKWSQLSLNCLKSNLKWNNTLSIYIYVRIYILMHMHARMGVCSDIEYCNQNALGLLFEIHL